MTNFITITANANKFHPSSCTHSAYQPDTFLTTYAFVGIFDWQM